MANQYDCYKEKDDQIVIARQMENQQFHQELASQYGKSLDITHLTDYVNLIAKETPELLGSASKQEAYEKLLFMARTLEALGRRDLVEQIAGFKKLH